MTRAADLRSIDCPACGAGLGVLGGGRVTTHVCGYCGTELDALDDYRALRRFTDMPRPDTPLRPGTTGQIHGVAFTVIGILGMREDYAGRTWTWVDHQLYSPTHGYVVMTLEDGHLTLTRRFRRTGWFLTAAEVERADTRPALEIEGDTYAYYDTSESRITFAEGEFTWTPEVGQSFTTVTALGSEAMLGFTRAGDEREVERSSYLPQAATWASFGVTDPPRPDRPHPTQPFRGGPNLRFLRVAGLAFALAALALAAVMAATPGRVALPETVLRLADLPAEIEVPITRTDRLARLVLRADVDNSWAFFDVTLSDPQDRPVFAAGREVGVYSGRDDEGAWREGNSTTTLHFHPPEAGTYTLEVDVPEAETWERAGAPLSAISVRMDEGVAGPLWLALLAPVFLAIALAGDLRRLFHEKRRWYGSDWSDED